MVKGKQKAWVAALFAAALALLNVLAGDEDFAAWASLALLALTPLAVYFTPNKPYVNVEPGDVVTVAHPVDSSD